MLTIDNSLKTSINMDYTVNKFSVTELKNCFNEKCPFICEIKEKKFFLTSATSVVTEVA